MKHAPATCVCVRACVCDLVHYCEYCTELLYFSSICALAVKSIIIIVVGVSSSVLSSLYTGAFRLCIVYIRRICEVRRPLFCGERIISCSVQSM